MTDIEEQFNLIAKRYDENRRKFIPCFHDYYEATTKMILSNIDSPKRVLDLGAGTGLLTYYWFKECKTADYVLVDIADEMLNVSRKRFAGLENIQHEILDYTKQLPEGEFDTIISALSIHIRRHRLQQRPRNEVRRYGRFHLHDLGRQRHDAKERSVGDLELGSDHSRRKCSRGK